MTYDLCFDRNPNNHGITCSLPHGHASPHAMGIDGATWPTTDEGNTHD